MGFVRKKYWTAGRGGWTLLPGGEALVDAGTGTLRVDLKSGVFQLSAVVRERVLRRVLLTLTRFGPRIGKVALRLDEPANPLGGIDRRCRLRAEVRGSEDVATEAIAEGFEEAVAKTVAVLAQRLDSGVHEEAERRGPAPGSGGASTRRLRRK